MNAAKEKYCPIEKGLCREDCVFHVRAVSTSNGIVECLIAETLSELLVASEKGED